MLSLIVRIEMVLGESSEIVHIATGGTIDSVWSPEDDTAIPAQTSKAAEYLQFLAQMGYPSTPSEVLMLKDSRQITIDDKKEIARRVAESAHPKILVTSGTYFMKELGARIGNHPSMRRNPFNKKVAMAASIVPLEGFSMSDGGFSLGMAHAALEEESITTPVMGVVNGMVASVDDIEKDLTTATFERLDPDNNLLGYNRYTFIPAGGSIDFEFDGLDGVQPATTSYIPTYLRKNVRSNVDFDATPPILKDSRNLTEKDMDLVVDLVREAPTEFVLVTSGLLRIARLRAVLTEALNTGDDRDRRVVLTGARYMLRSLDKTDAPYNLGYAHGKLGLVDPGVHVAVAGRIIDDQDDPLQYCYTTDELKGLGYVE